MKGDTAIFIGVGVSLAAVTGLVLWGLHNRKLAASSDVQQVGMFPNLKVGTVVLVDTVKANLLFVPSPTVTCVVDQILTDKSIVSVSIVGGGLPGGLPVFSGTIERSAIIKIIAEPIPGGLQT